MELGSAIVGTVLLALCIVPFVVMYYKRVHRENRMMQTLKEHAHPHHGEIHRHEICGDFILGMDEHRNFVFFFNQNNGKSISQFIDLAKIQTCQVVRKTRNADNKTGGFGSTERVELSFNPADKLQEETRWVLYDGSTTVQLNGELQVAEKWAKEINARLKSKT